MTAGRKPKERIERKALLVGGCSLPLRDDNAEEPPHRSKRTEEAGSVAMREAGPCVTAEQEQHQCKRRPKTAAHLHQRGLRSRVIVPPLCLSFTSQRAL